MKVHHVWFPLYDQPVTLRLSREQLQIVQDSLRGDHTTSRAGWRASLADQFERVLVESLGDQESSVSESEL